MHQEASIQPKRPPFSPVRLTSALLLAVWVFLGMGRLPSAVAQPPDYVLRMGQTIVLTVPEGVDRVVVGDGNVIDAKPITGQNHDLLITAKTPGFTNIIVWPSPTRGPDGHMVQGPFRDYKIEVLTYRRPEMVAVRVKVLEVDRTETGNAGVGWSQSVSWTEAPPNAPFRIGLPTRSSLLEATLNLLLQTGKAKLLAAPTLLTMSGSSASFLAGGEIPIPLILQNSAAIEWKQYGIKLQVDPRVEGNDTIVLKVRPEVSRIDNANAIKLPNITVPAIATRWTETNMQVRNGESIVISGLLSDENDETVTGIPVLSSIPIFGELFKTHQTNKNHTELVFFLTPAIVNNPGGMPENDYGQH